MAADRGPISVVTELTGPGAHTLRGHVRAGLPHPARAAGGMHLYSPRNVAPVCAARLLWPATAST